jgi:uncharacterized membrane protein
MLSILLVTALILVGYHLSAGCPFRSMLLSVAVVTLFAILDPTLQHMQPAVYILAILSVWLSVMFVLPLAEGRRHLWSWRAGRVLVAVAYA